MVRLTKVDAKTYTTRYNGLVFKFRHASKLTTKANSPRHLPSCLTKLSTAVKIHAVANPAIITMPIDTFYSLNTTLSMSKA